MAIRWVPGRMLTGHHWNMAEQDLVTLTVGSWFTFAGSMHKVVAVGAKSIRYATPIEGWDTQVFHTVTPKAFATCVGVGLISVVELGA